MLDPGASLQLAGLHIPPVGSQRVHSLHIVYPLKLIRAGCGTRFRGMRSLTFAACGSKTLFSIIFATSPLAKSWIRAWGPMTASDYDLAFENFKMKLKVRRYPESPRIRFDLDKLNDPGIVEMFQTQIGGNCAAFNLSRLQILSLLIYLTATLIRQDLTLSHTYNPPWLQVLMGVKVKCVGGDQTAYVVLILLQLNKTVKKHLLKLDDVTHNDVIRFDSILLFLSAYIIAPILTTCCNVSTET